ncbi:MAG: hypothetical protein LBI63_02510 [Candidatus Ancillula sp.]|jgi:hypothetical protein|nr:hypothetical protein [Candidatus Ancillula sp.]
MMVNSFDEVSGDTTVDIGSVEVSLVENPTADANSSNKTIFKLKKNAENLKTLSQKKLAIIIGAAIIGAALIVVIAVIAIVLVVRSYNWTSGNLEKITAYKAKTVNEIANLKSEYTFKHGEPILLKLELKAVQGQNLGIRWELHKADPSPDDQDSIVKKSALPLNNSNEKSNQYIALVSSTKTALESGKYVVKFYTDQEDSKQIGQYKISITE